MINQIINNYKNKIMKNKNFFDNINKLNFSPLYILTINTLIYRTNISKPNLPFNDLMVNYFTIWSIEQWVYSLVSLIIIYFIAGKIFNKYCSKKIDWKKIECKLVKKVLKFCFEYGVGIF